MHTKVFGHDEYSDGKRKSLKVFWQRIVQGNNSEGRVFAGTRLGWCSSIWQIRAEHMRRETYFKVPSERT